MAISGRDLMRTVGPAWIAGVLIMLIVSAFLPGPRAFLEKLSLLTHLLLFWAALSPGVALLWLAERRK